MAEAKKGKGSRRGREDWQRLLAKLDRSGLSVAAFCRREGVSAANLYRWRGVLGAVGDAGETAVSSTPSASAFVDLRTENGVSGKRCRESIKTHLIDHRPRRPRHPRRPTDELVGRGAARRGERIARIEKRQEFTAA